MGDRRMFNVITNRAPVVASHKNASALLRRLAALSSVACVAMTLLFWQFGETHAARVPHGGLTPNAAARVSPAATATRGKIAFSRRTRFGREIFVMNPDDTIATQLTSAGGENDEPAWSPDGKQIAFTSTRDGNYEVYVMNADGSGQTNLTKSGAPETSPAWSPDGKQIAFVGFVEGRGFQIHVMNADGSGRRSLSGDRGSERDPAWSPDGTRIAFTRDTSIHLMNADGGGVVRLTQGTAPAWSPDGARIAFVSQGWPSTGGQTIRVINAEGTGERVVAVPPNPTTGPSWSPDGTEIVYDAHDYAIFRIEVDGCRAVAELLNTSGRDRQPAWQLPAALPAPAPAATPCPASTPAATPVPRASDRVLFTSLRDGNHEIYVMNGDGTGQTNLTNNPAQDASPVWSPDGTRIAFTSNRPGPANPTGRSNIYVMNADGSGVRQLTRNGEGNITDGRVYDPAWSPDGTKLVFVSSFMGELSNLVVINVEGELAATFISTIEAADPAWSPDGTRIAYAGREGVSNLEDLTGARHIYVVNADGSGKTRLTNIASPFNSFPYPPQASGPSWSPDGKRLVFAGKLGNDEIYSISATGGVELPLTAHPAQDLMPAWLPDGSGIGFTSYRDAQQRDIYLMSPDGSGQPARLTSHPADDFDPDWHTAERPPRPAAESTIQFSRSSIRIREGSPPGDTVTVTRLGDLSRAASVDFTTRELCPPAVACDGAARDRSDYVRTQGTLRFAPGEAEQTIDITVIDDALIEIEEFFTVTLDNAVGASLGALNSSGVAIADNDSNPAAQNPIDTPHFFVRMHYLDFLGREPEPGGLQAWVDVLNRCPNIFNTDSASSSSLCDRIHVSSSFFRAPEFEFKGYYVFLFYRVSLGRSPTYNEFLRDLLAVSGETAGEVVANKAAFASAWVQRAEFQAIYGDRISAEGFVDRLLQVAGLTLGGEVTRDTLVEDLRAARKTQAEVVRAVAEHPAARAKEFNGAFVTMQYFGYLKRDPEEEGYNAWLRYLNANPTDFRTMIHGFMNSVEYRSRFGRP
jgi:Tol biopolymer transport system component